MSTFTGESSDGRRKKGKMEEAAVRVRRININDFLEEPEYRAKSMYICLSPRRIGCGRKLNLTQTDVHHGVFFRGLTFDIPPHLVQNDSYGVTVIQSKFYFIGGSNISRKNLLNLVSIFDSTTSSWNTGPPLNQPRLYPVVLTYQNNLFVFGSRRCFPWAPTILLTPETFAEYYDFSLEEWRYLPSPPEEFIGPGKFILSHAFSQARGVAYFWVNGVGVYSYHFIFKTWTPIFDPSSFFDPDVGLQWSNTAVILGPFLIWHHFGTIYAFSDVLLPIFTFKNPFEMFGNPSDIDLSQSYLVNVGKGKLCLVYGYQHFQDSDSIRCHLFDVQFSGNSLQPTLTLTHEGCKVYNHTSYDISSVFTMDHDRELEREDVSPSEEDILHIPLF